MTVERHTEAVPSVRTRTVYMRVGTMWTELTDRGWNIGDMGHVSTVGKIGELHELIEAVESEIYSGNSTY